MNLIANSAFVVASAGVQAATRINAQTVKCCSLSLSLSLFMCISKVVLADDVVVVLAEYFNLADSQCKEGRQGRGRCLSLLQISNKSNICAAFLIEQKCNKIERQSVREREQLDSAAGFELQLQQNVANCNKQQNAALIV